MKITQPLNLDSMTSEDLTNFWSLAFQFHPVRTARILFPEKPKGFVRATKNLGLYAANKATAMNLRKEGSINDAVKYELICDKIYAELPKFAKTW